MDPSSIILLYSKYSPNCKKILSVYDASLSFIKPVCIDNAQIRQRLSNSTSLNIKTVPCVLFRYPDGRLEKFENDNVTDWVIEQISNNISETPYTEVYQESHQPQPQSSQPRQTQPQPQPESQQSYEPQETDNYSGQQVTSMEDLFEQEESSQPVPNRNQSVSELAANMTQERDMLQNSSFNQENKHIPTQVVPEKRTTSTPVSDLAKQFEKQREEIDTTYSQQNRQFG